MFYIRRTQVGHNFCLILTKYIQYESFTASSTMDQKKNALDQSEPNQHMSKNAKRKAQKRNEKEKTSWEQSKSC